MITIKNMKSVLHKIILFAGLLFFADLLCYSQSGTVQTDTTKVSQKKTETVDANQNQAQTQTKNQNQGTSQKAANNKVIKQVKSAKPDMSKAKGARPNIVRPSGSNIPKGAGKPGGVKRMGGR
jgi:hypothetical protein